LRRAAATATAIAELQPQTVQVTADDRLTEIAQGDWEGLLLAEVTSRYADELAAWRRAPTLHHAPGGESLAEAAARVRASLVDIVATLPRQTPMGYVYDPVPGYVAPLGDPTSGEPIATRAGAAEANRANASGTGSEPWAVVVAHDGIFRLVLASLLGMSMERFWSLPFVLTGITVVTLHDGVAALRAHNLSDHLEPLAIQDRAAQESRGERRGAL
jgi:broad specificity phosphatase PhoE